MRACARIRLRFAEERCLETVFRALEPEVGKAATLRSCASLRRKGEFLVLRIEAKDTVALRAASNAYMRWVDSVVKVLGILKQES
jgi:tRNA threonylcarbamoyladenosine modification (KEOPS) complex  Pcc1 subunit